MTDTYAPEDEDLSTDELAARAGVSRRTLERHATQAAFAPSTWLLDGERRWSLSRFVECLRAVQAAGSRVGTGQGRRADLAAQAHAPGADAGRSEELRARMRAVRSKDEVLALYRDVLDQAYTGSLSPTATQAIMRGLADLERLLDKQVRAGDVPEVLVSAEGAELAELYEGLVDGRRRDELLQLARKLARADAAEFNAERPEEAAAKMEAAGLDAFGEPRVEEAAGGEAEEGGGDPRGPGAPRP